MGFSMDNVITREPIAVVMIICSGPKVLGHFSYTLIFKIPGFGAVIERCTVVL